MEKTNPLLESLGSFLRTAWDLMVLNWLFILCSLPVITVGPALCAMLAVTLKLARGEPVYGAKDFFRNFRANFRPALLMGLLAGVLLVVAAGDLVFALQQSGSFRSLYLILGIFLCSLALTLISYGFGLLAMFENPLKLQLSNAFRLAFLAPGKTVAMWMIWLFPILALVALPLNVVWPLGFLYVLAGASAPAYFNSRILRDVFDRINGAPVIPE